VKAADLDQITWLNPANYFTRPIAALSLAVARDVALGAHPLSVAAKYGIRHCVRDWLNKGFAAAKRDADQNDLDSQYLDFYLKLSQAMGIAQAEAEQYNHANAPQWWISHNSESASQWGGGAVGAGVDGSVLASEVVESTKSGGGASLAPPSSLDIRAVMRTIIESGAAVPSPGTADLAASSPAADDREARPGTMPGGGDTPPDATGRTGTDG
jgi:hypothetical protein